jgi:hypothetical protein
MEYMTTKKANSKVMKSAYDTSQRSWFSCSSVRFFLAMVLLRGRRLRGYW